MGENQKKPGRKYFEAITKGWNKLPALWKRAVIILWMFIMGNSFPWKLFLGDAGGYVQAALLLGAIFLGLRTYNEFQKSREKGAGHGGHSK